MDVNILSLLYHVIYMIILILFMVYVFYHLIIQILPLIDYDFDHIFLLDLI